MRKLLMLVLALCLILTSFAFAEADQKIIGVIQKNTVDAFHLTINTAAIEALDGGESLFFSHYDPKTVEWFMSIL